MMYRVPNLCQFNFDLPYTQKGHTPLPPTPMPLGVQSSSDSVWLPAAKALVFQDSDGRGRGGIGVHVTRGVYRT